MARTLPTPRFSPTPKNELCSGGLGYPALALMLVDVVLLWRYWARHGDAVLPANLHLYARLAYIYWVIAYFTGAAMVMAAKRAGH